MAADGGMRARARAWAGAAVAAAARRPVISPLGLSVAAQKLNDLIGQWIIAELGPGRLVPWIAIGFGVGIVGYFAAEVEPAWWSALAASVIAIVAAAVTRHRPMAFALTIALAAAALGFTVATLKSLRIAHPVLGGSIASATISGFVEIREERERSDRIVVRVQHMDAPRLREPLERVRVSVRKGTAPPVGAFVEFKARLSPPLAPLRPGGYDFARDLYFQRIGASGFVLGTITIGQSAEAPSFWLRYAATIDGIREAIDKRIRAVVPGDKGAIASALITGKRDAITTPVNDAMYISSLAHVLSISG